MWGLCAVFVALQTKKETSEGTGMRSGVKGGGAETEASLYPRHTANTLPLSKIQHSSYLRKGAVDLIDNKRQKHLRTSETT